MEMEKQMFGEQMFAGPALTGDTEKILIKWALLGSSMSITLVPIKLQLSMRKAPLLEHILYLNSFWQLGEHQRFFLNLLFLKTNQLKIISQTGIFGVVNSISSSSI